jgi:hypothetical protein
VTRRLPERTLLGSVAVPDIVLAHRASDPDRVTSGVTDGRWQLEWPSRDGLSAYDLICRSPYDLMCRSVSAC